MNQIGKYDIQQQIEIQNVYYKRDFLSEEQTTNQKWFESIPFVNPFLACFLDANVSFLITNIQQISPFEIGELQQPNPWIDNVILRNIIK